MDSLFVDERAQVDVLSCGCIFLVHGRSNFLLGRADPVGMRLCIPWACGSLCAFVSSVAEMEMALLAGHDLIRDLFGAWRCVAVRPTISINSNHVAMYDWSNHRCGVCSSLDR